MVALRALVDQRLRFALTVGGVALCVILMLFLGSVYRGVRDGSVEYVRRSEADLWVLQRHATNILRGSSMLPAAHGDALRASPGVARASPVLFLMAGASVEGGSATLYVTGFDPETGVGGPPALERGRASRTGGEIVLDRSFAAKHGLDVGVTLRVGDADLRVVGLSSGTNMFVIQYAFVTLAQAQAMAGLPATVSAFLVQVAGNGDASEVAARLERELGVEAYDHATFLANNVREMEAGFLPLLYTVALIGAIVLTAILSLILSVSVVERRQDFAVMKALGAPGGFVPGLVVQQALWLTGLGFALALLLFFPLVRGIEALVPEVSARSSWSQIVAAGCGVTGIGLIGSLLPIQRLRRIYPLEVFR